MDSIVSLTADSTYHRLMWRLWVTLISVTSACISVFGSQVFSLHTISERHHSVLVGDTLKLECNFTETDYAVNWLFDSKDGRTSGRKVCDKGHVVNNRIHQFAMEHSSKNVYNLILLVAKPGDAGTYRCIEDDGFGPRVIAHHVTVDEPSITLTTSELDSQPRRPLQSSDGTFAGFNMGKNAGNELRPTALVILASWQLLLTWL